MTARAASCRCGAIRLTCTGEPGRVSVCHCLACQKRSGSAFAAQARFPRAAVAIDGDPAAYVHVGDSGSPATFLFCRTCGTTIAYGLDRDPDTIAVPLGAFDDPYFATPAFSVFENRMHPWLAITGDGIAHD